MSHILHSRVLSKAMGDHGVVPPNCRSFELVVQADGTALLRYEVFVVEADVSKLAAAFAAAAEAAKL